MSPQAFTHRLHVDPLTGWFSCVVDVAGWLASGGVQVSPHDVSAAIVRAGRDLAAGLPWVTAGGEVVVTSVYGESDGAGWQVGIAGSAVGQARQDLLAGSAHPWVTYSVGRGPHRLSLTGVAVVPVGARVLSSRSALP